MHIFFLSNSFSSLLLNSVLLLLSSSPSGFLLTFHDLLPLLSYYRCAQYLSSYKILSPLSTKLSCLFPQFPPQTHQTQCFHFRCFTLKDGPFTPQQSFSRSIFLDKTQNPNSTLSLIFSLFWLQSWNLAFWDCFHGASHFSTHSAPSFSLSEIHPETPALPTHKIVWVRMLLLPLIPNPFLVMLTNTVWDKLKITVNWNWTSQNWDAKMSAKSPFVFPLNLVSTPMLIQKRQRFV